MCRNLHAIIVCLFLAALIVSPVVAQTPQPTVPLPFSPQVQSSVTALDPLSVALLTFLGAIVAGATGYIGAWFKRRTDAEATKVIVEAKAAETKAAIDKKAQAIKDDLEQQAADDRKELRMVFKQQNDELKLELKNLRENTEHEISSLRLELRDARTDTKAQTQITTSLQEKHEANAVIITGLQKEIIEGHQREEQLRKDVDHMPNEIARLEALLVKKGNGDGQGASKSVLDAGSTALVDAAKDDKP